MKRENEHKEYCEQDILDQISRMSEDTEVPDSLRSENIDKLLEKKKQKKHFRPYQIGLVAAACVAVVAGTVVWQYGRMHNGVINSSGVSGSNAGSSAGNSNTENKISNSKKIRAARSYDEIYKYIKRAQDNSGIAMYARGGNEIDVQDSASTAKSTESSIAKSTAPSSTASATDTGIATTAAKGNYSQTNIRQSGVDEGDIAKTDGTYLYVLKDKSDQIAIIDTRDNRMKQTATITVEDVSEIQEMYLDIERNQLIAVCDGYVGGKWNDDDYGYGQRANTTAVTYDISDRENPKEVGRVSQSGYYNSSRIADGYLYLFSDYYVTLDGITAKNPKSYIPLVNDNLIKETDICLPSISKADMYSIITSVSLENPNETAHSKALLADGGNLYVSNDNIYFYENVWQYSGKDVTTIRKVSYESGKLTAGAQCKIDGYINDSFSIDEYDGYLRVVVTDGDTNSVYVLNQELKETGSIKGLAEDERVYSARFMGKAGYFVTFKETDPLFSVDLSDPKNPKIIGALKIPGFSDYLHPYGKNKLLGIGMNVDEKTMSTDGVKLTMFDISDPENVKEEQTYVIENVYYTDVSYDYKAALVDAEKNLIGFAADSEGGREYYTFSYDLTTTYKSLTINHIIPFTPNLTQPPYHQLIHTNLYTHHITTQQTPTLTAEHHTTTIVIKETTT